MKWLKFLKKSLDFYYFSKVGYLMKNKEYLTEKGYDEILFIKTLKKHNT